MSETTDAIDNLNDLLSSVQGVASAFNSLSDVKHQVQESVNGFDRF